MDILCDLLRSVWSFIVGSLRMVLFFGCLIVMLFQISYLTMVYNRGTMHFYLPETSRIHLHYTFSLALLLLSLIGCYGSFYKHHSSIKAYSLTSACTTAFLILVLLYFMSSNDIDRENKLFAKSMNDFAKQYNWYGSPGDGRSELATKAWDSLQSLHCCGIEGPKYWIKVRPKSINYYPASCCFNRADSSKVEEPHEFCNEDSPELYTAGCMRRIEELESAALVMCTLFVGFQFILCVISCIVSNLGFDNNEAQSSNNYLFNGSSPPQGYQRFGAPLYTHSPPDIYQNSEPKNGPQIYPNIDGASVPGYPMTPPPRYGTT